MADDTMGYHVNETMTTPDARVDIHTLMWSAPSFIPIKQDSCAIWLDLEAKAPDEIGFWQLDSGNEALELGRCGTIAANTVVNVMLPPGRKRCAVCYVEPALFERLTGVSGTWFDERFVCRLKQNDHALRRTLVAIAEELSMPRFAREVALEGYVLVLMSEIGRIMQYTDAPNDSYRLSRQELNRLLEIIDSEMHLDVSLARMASAVGMSRRHLSRSFKATTGTTYREYLESSRMRRACELLTQTSLPLKVVAYKVGLSGADYLCTAFSRSKGMSPTAYRQIAGHRR